MAGFNTRQLHAWQLSFGEMSRALILTFFYFFFFIFSFPLFSHAAQVTMGWNASTDPRITGYKLYYGTLSKNYHAVIDVGNKTTYTISGLPIGSTYYFAATGYDSSGVESGYSNEVVYNSANNTGPPTVNDFNGDGQTDLLWQHQTNGGVLIWFMDGAGYLGSKNITLVADTNWKIKGAADFDANGSPDILWHNQTSGALTVWFMNGTTVTGAAYIGSVGATWAVAGVADFDGNGFPDILWHNQTSGALAVWYMSGTTVSGNEFISWVMPPWKIVAP